MTHANTTTLFFGGLALLGILTALGMAPLPPRFASWEEELDIRNFDTLGLFSGRVTRQEFDEALRLIDPKGQMTPALVYDDSRLRVYESGKRSKVFAEVTFRDPRSTPWSGPARPVRRVMLDPGHRGGAWSEIEKRHVTLNGGPPVREGDLTFATALVLRERLETAGVTVALTRGEPPSEPFPYGVHDGFDADREAAQWLAENRAEASIQPWARWPSLLGGFFLGKRKEAFIAEQAFALYNRYELRLRSDQAAAWEPDVTLSLHYNMTGGEPRNGILVFVPGNFMSGELETLSQRFFALRRALDGTLPATLELARRIGEAMQRHMELPVLYVPARQPSDLRNKVELDVGSGVYARNLAILRRTPGVALLLEGPCMDHPEEYQRLLGDHVTAGARTVPRRVEQYASAVFEALMQH